MGLHKGQTNNPNGRKPGSQNKLTKELRTVLKDFIFQELENLPKKLDELDTPQRLEIVIKLLPYAMPKVKDVSGDQGEPLGFGW